MRPKQAMVILLVPLLMSCGVKHPLAPDAGKTSQDLILAPTAESLPEPRPILDEVERRYREMESLKAIITNWSTHEGKSSSMRVDAFFQKPERYGMTVLANSDPQFIGTKLVYTGGDRCQVMTPFLGFPLKLSVGIGNSQICTLRGDTILDLGLARMMEILLDPAAQTRTIGQAWLQDASLVILEVKSARTLKNASKEVYYIDDRDFLPRIREVYENDHPVVRCEFEGIVIDPELPGNAFTLD